MARFNAGSPILLGLCAITFVLIIIHIGVAGNVTDNLLNGSANEISHANNATSYLLVFSFLGDMIALAAITVGLMHALFGRDLLTRISLATLATEAFFVYLLAFGFGCKQESIGYTGDYEDTVFAFTLFLTLASLLLAIFSWMGHDWNAAGAGYGSGLAATNPKPGFGGPGVGMTPAATGPVVAPPVATQV